jgi:hypothetical protein
VGTKLAMIADDTISVSRIGRGLDKSDGIIIDAPPQGITLVTAKELAERKALVYSMPLKVPVGEYTRICVFVELHKPAKEDATKPKDKPNPLASSPDLAGPVKGK